MMTTQWQELHDAYVEELRDSKNAAERWWTELNESYAGKPDFNLNDLWPMGLVSHPWVIATYRKHFFRCVQLNSEIQARKDKTPLSETESEDHWGKDDVELTWETIEPKIFTLNMLLDGETHDLYEFLLSLVFVPIGLKADELV